MQLFLLECGLLGVTASSAVAAGPDHRPNVILFLTDDQRWDTLQYMPAVQRLLVERGVTFSNAFATMPARPAGGAAPVVSSRR